MTSKYNDPILQSLFVSVGDPLRGFEGHLDFKIEMAFEKSAHAPRERSTRSLACRFAA